MKDQHAFDDLARQKLEEREFAFQEADWLAAQGLINGTRRRKGAWLPFFLAGMGLMIAGIAAWWVFDAKQPEVQQVVSVEQTELQVTTSVAADDPEGSVEDGSSNNGAAEGAIAVPTQAFDASMEKSIRAHKSDDHPNASPVEKTSTRPARSIVPTAITSSPVASKPASTAQANDANAPAMVQETRDEAITDAAATRTGTNADGDTPDMSAALPTIAAPATIGANEAMNTDGPSTTMTVVDSAADTLNAHFVPATDRSTDVPAALNDTSTTTPRDSVEAVTALPPILPIPTVASPWEFSMLFGGMLSGTTYTGGNSAEWASDLKGEWTATGGAEVMHLGRNFGIGTGLHYTTYMDRSHIAAKDLSTTVISDSSYFQANQVTLLYILGNVQINGQDYYVTESRDTVINVLVTTTTSSTSTIRLIDARDIVLQVSYFEIPLLLDAHVIQGPWAIGLRGGPTVGLLSGRKGMVPNSTFDGYEALGEQQFRSTVFGLTARAYIRYRWTNGWSVGLEPTWRGQLGNAMDGGELERRSSAVGALLSLSYHLK